MGRLAGFFLLGLAACATAPTEEESVLAAVEEIRLALAGDDADAVWDLFSTRHRNVYEEARRARAGEADPPTAENPWPLDLGQLGTAVSREVAAGMTAREFYRALHEPLEDVPALGGDVEIRFEDDRADVDDVAHRYRWWLRREDDAWTLDMLLHPEFHGAGMEVHTCASGREIVLAVTVELSRKKVHEVPLPVVPGEQALPHQGLETRVALERDGRVEMKGEFLGDPDLKERLLVHAERQRDLGHPLQYSTVPFLLAIHRELSWHRVEEVLWLMADLDVRIRRVTFLTAEYPDDRRGVEVQLGARARPTQVRYAEPDVEVRIGRADVTPARLSGLASALAAGPDADFEKGIRVYVSPDLPVGDALSALVVVGRHHQVVHHLAPEPFAGWTVDGEPVEPAETAESPPDPGTLHLTLVIRLPPGAESPTALFRRLLVALDRGARHEIRDLLAPSARGTMGEDPYPKVKGATQGEVAVEGDRATVGYDGPRGAGVLHLVREGGRWYLTLTDPR